jgi:hypothetical protein
MIGMQGTERNPAPEHLHLVIVGTIRIGTYLMKEKKGKYLLPSKQWKESYSIKPGQKAKWTIEDIFRPSKDSR